MMAKKDRPTAGEMFGRLSARIEKQKGAWILMTEVRNATGYSHHVRSCDALAMSLWPSAGLELHGFEIKVSRSDLVKELTNHQKAEEIKQYCDRWWLVLPSEKLIKPNELPKDWGLLCSHGDSLCIKKAAPMLEAEPIPRHFLASILRAASLNQEMEHKIIEARDKGFESGKAHEQRFGKGNPDELKNMQRTIDAFQEMVGEPIRLLQIHDLARRVQVAKALDPENILRRTTLLRDQLTNILDRFSEGENGKESS